MPMQLGCNEGCPRIIACIYKLCDGIFQGLGGLTPGIINANVHAKVGTS